MIIVTSQYTDLTNIAHCHRRAFPQSLSSQLRIAYTCKMLEWYLADSRGVLFHVCSEDKIIGYCGAIKTKEPGLAGSSTSMAQFSFHEMILSLLLKPWLLFHPENFKRFALIKKNILLKLKLHRKPVAKPSSTNSFDPYWGLVVIGVDPAFQGKGTGSLLLQEFERLAKEDDVKTIFLSVKKVNSKAIKSYERNGWLVHSSNADSLTMYKKL